MMGAAALVPGREAGELGLFSLEKEGALDGPNSRLQCKDDIRVMESCSLWRCTAKE